MKYRKIGMLDQEISQLVLGSMVFSLDDVFAGYGLLDRFFEAGGNAVDTAYIYSGGDGERLLGMWMKKHGNRTDVFVAGKGGHPNGKVPRPRIAPEEVRADIDTTLIRMQTDYIDLYMLHRDDEQIPVSTVIDYFNEEIGRGRVRSVAVSNWQRQRIIDANEYANSRGLKGLVVSSNNFSLAVAMRPHWHGVLCVDRPAWEWHKETQLALMPWSSQARGFFSGKFAPDKRDDRHMVEIYYNNENFERLNRAQSLGREKGSSAIQISLAYVMQQPFPIFPIIGPRNLDELDSSLGAVTVELTEKEMQWLNLEIEGL